MKIRKSQGEVSARLAGERLLGRVERRLRKREEEKAKSRAPYADPRMGHPNSSHHLSYGPRALRFPLGWKMSRVASRGDAVADVRGMRRSGRVELRER